jgi:hypothetical protein
MKKIALLALCFIALAVVGCKEEPPDYVGVWVDATTLALAGTTVTFDLDADAATLTIDNTLADDVVVVGSLEQTNSTTLTTTITQMTVGVGPPLTGAALEAALFATYGLTPVNTFTYSVAGNTMTITSALILALTNNFTNTLTAVRS